MHASCLTKVGASEAQKLSPLPCCAQVPKQAPSRAMQNDRKNEPQPCAHGWPSAFTLTDLDAFDAAVIIPRANTRLQTGFFSNRVVDGAKKHIRAFAGEVLTALQVLGLFTSVVLAPSNALPDYVVLMQLTCAVLDLLQRGDEACAHTKRPAAFLMTRLHRQLMTVMPQ